MLDPTVLKQQLADLQHRYPRADAHGAPPAETLSMLEALFGYVLALDRKVALLEQGQGAEPAPTKRVCGDFHGFV